MTTGADIEHARRTTLADVARAAGVSVSTASRSLRGDARIAEPTRARVNEIAEQLGYVPHVAARNLVLRRSHTLGLMIPDVTDPIHGQIVTGFQMRAAELGYSVILANGFHDVAVERRALAEFAAHRVEGAVLMGSVLRQSAAVRALRPGIAVFVDSEHLDEFGYHEDLPLGCLRTDDGDGMAQVVRYLIDEGYELVAFLGGTPLATEAMRRRALTAALREAGRPDPLIYLAEGGTAGLSPPLAEQIVAGGAQVVVCYDDKLALHLIDALRTIGVRVPDDVGVIGFDDIPFSRISNPRLTTVAQASEELGILGAGMLADAIRTGSVPASRSIPATLVVRESTGRRSTHHQPASERAS